MERPTFSLKTIEERRDRLNNEILGTFRDQRLQAELFNQFVAFVQERLPGTTPYDVVFESSRYLLGRQVTPIESLNFAWRLAGNAGLLREGKPVYPWAGQRTDEWVPLQVLRAVALKNQRNVTGTEYTFRVLAGSPSGMKVTAFWKPGLVRLMKEKFGFSKYIDGAYPFRNARELVGLRFFGMIDGARSGHTVQFAQYDGGTSLIEWNREHVLRMRARIEPCPRGWRHPCHKCAVGYVECKAATHLHTYQTGFCEKCNKADAVFDPGDASPHCIVCTHRTRMRA